MAKIHHTRLFRNFAQMRHLLAIVMMMAALSCQAQNTADGQASDMPKGDPLKELMKLPQFNNYPQGPPPGVDTALIKEPDGSKLHVISFGGHFINYTETVDGYTVVLNDAGVFEYAERGEKGDLKGCGVDARDPDQRTAPDNEALSRIPKHMRYDGDKLKMLIYKQYKWDESVYYGQQYRKYKESNSGNNNTDNQNNRDEADKSNPGK